MLVRPVLTKDFARFEFFALAHAFTLMSAGNMSEKYEDASTISLVAKRKKKVFDVLGCQAGRWVGILPKHSAKVEVISENHLGDFLPCDGLITFIPGTVLTLAPADCFPVIMTDREKSFASILHAGWHGLDKGIINNCLGRLLARGIKSRDLIAAVGPGIQRCCYENPELYNRRKWQKFVSDGPLGKLVDLLNKIIYDLLAGGVSSENIRATTQCTYCSRDDDGSPLFFSHQRSLDTGEPEGRFLAAVLLKA